MLYTMFNFKMENQQNPQKCKNLKLAVFLGVTHLLRAKTFTVHFYKIYQIEGFLFFCSREFYL